MTFIASVKAKDGVAIIADSLVTSSRRVADFSDFMNYISSISKPGETGIKLDHREIAALFINRPLHTKDYEDKLYQYGKFTAITTAGSASINGKRIKKLVGEAIKKFKPNGRSSEKSCEKNITDLKEFITNEVKKYLRKNPVIRSTVFIITSFIATKGTTLIHKLNVKETDSAALELPDFEFVSVEPQDENHTVICDGQNRLSERLLFGDIDNISGLIPSVINKVAIDFGIPQDEITPEYITSFYSDPSIITRQMFEDMKIFKLTELSIQQAVDLASLLMRIEIDIQKYTENIPTVGGVIKLAVIDELGFRYLSGHDIVKHENFFY